MDKIILVAIFSFLNLGLSAQNDTTYFDADWNKCGKVTAKFYRLVEKKDSKLLVKDYYLNGQPQMIFLCSSIEPECIKDGPFTRFDKNGYKTSKGFYTNNTPTGTWTWYEKNESDSTIATYQSNGLKNYTRFSKNRLKEEADNRVYELADLMPSFPGGYQAMKEYVYNNFKISKKDKKSKVSGTFYASFVVNKSGKLTDIKILKSLSPDCDLRAIELIENMPIWIPGEIDNKKVRVKYNLPITVE